MPPLSPTLGRGATVRVLTAGYLGDRVASTVSYVEEGTRKIVIDPGMVSRRERILAPLRRLGVAPEEVTDIVLSHHHPDHTVNCALFPRARIHDHWAEYLRDRWTSRRAEGLRLAPSVRLLETPGHTPQDITTLVGTAEGVVAFTHLWWDSKGPRRDPYATDPTELLRQRRRILSLARTIVPGHGAPFLPPVRRAR